MLHEVVHLYLIRDQHWRLDGTGFGNRQANEATARPEFYASRDTSESVQQTAATCDGLRTSHG